MSDERLAALLNELLSDDEEDAEALQGEASGDIPDFDPAVETPLFEEEELEAALSELDQCETPQKSTGSRRDAEIVPPHGDGTALTTHREAIGGEIEEASNDSTEEYVETEPVRTVAEEEKSSGSDIRTKGLYPELDDVEMTVRRLWRDSAVKSESTLLGRIKSALKTAEDDWNPEGRPDAHGGMIGGTVALRAVWTDDPLSKALQNQARYGTPLVICERFLRGSSLVSSVGTSRGLVIVQIRSLSLQGVPNYELFELTDAKGLGTITAMTFSPFSEKEKLLLAVGNIDGSLTVWDVSGRKCIASISGHLGAAVLWLTFLPNRTPSVLLSSDANGGVYYHTLTSWVVRTSVSTKVISEGNKQPLLFGLFPMIRPNEDTDDTPTPASVDPRYVFGEGMACLCHPNVCSIARLSNEGRLSVYYQIPKPTNMEEDVMAVVAWAPLGTEIAFARHPNPDIDGCIPCGVLAIAWGKRLSLLRVPLLGDPLPDTPNIRHLPQQMETADWIRLAHEIHITSIAAWESPEEDGLVLSCCWLPNDRLGILRRRGILSQFVLFDQQLQILDRVEVDDCPIPYTLRSQPSELTTSLPSVSTSGEVVTVLGSVAVKMCKFLDWTESVSVLVGIDKWMMALHLLASIYCQATGQEYDARMKCAHRGTRSVDALDKSMSETVVGFLDWSLQLSESRESMPLSQIAELIVDLCVWNGQIEVLFSEIFTRFSASNVREVFLEKLEKSLTSNELRARVPPEVMQCLVEYCCEIGEPEKVERCVLRMDISSLDLNQVIPLCIEHHLFTALLSIFSNALLRDCITPARYLATAVLTAKSDAQAHDYGMKLLHYLRCCLCGESYPPGKEEIDDDRAQLTRQQMLGFVLFTNRDDLRRASLRIAPASQEEGHNADFDFAEPHPVLRCLLSVNASLLLRLFKDVLQDWECMEKDLLEAFHGGAVEEMPSVRSVTQVIVDALIDLMGSFSEERAIWMQYLCHCVASGRAVISPSTAMMLLEHLSRVQTAKYVESEAEHQFCGIVQSLGVELDASKESGVRLTYFEGQKALGLALNANMLVAVAVLHHFFQDYDAALHFHIKAGRTASGGCFTYFESSVAHFVEYQRLDELERLKGAVLGCISELANLDPERAASMVMRHFPNDQEVVIQALHGTRQLLFKYLKSSLEAALNQAEVSLSSDTSQLLTKSHCTLYVNLMCEYDPSGVLPFLKTYDHLVDVQQCKADCIEFGLKDAAAHLLEREGDVMGALNVLVEKMTGANKKMDKSILSRSLDSLDTSLSRQLSLSAILRVSATPDTRLHQLPKEVHEAQSSLASAVMLCRRNSLERGRRSEADGNRRSETVRLWFAVLKVYIEAFKTLPSYTKKQKKSIHVPSGFYHKGIIKSNDRFLEYPRLAFLRDVYAALMDEVITAMADYVPLMEVAELIINEHGQDRFGDFRSTLLSLINAYHYEQNILTSIGRLLSSDAYRVLLACYKKRCKALPLSGPSARL